MRPINRFLLEHQLRIARNSCIPKPLLWATPSRGPRQVTGGRLEIKRSAASPTSWVALARSKDAADAALWRDWYLFTLEMALAGAFSRDVTEQKMARAFITTALAANNRAAGESVFSLLRRAGWRSRRSRPARITCSFSNTTFSTCSRHTGSSATPRSTR